jgi:hypothetical protein
MRLDLHCSACASDFALPADSPVAAILDRVAEQGPWSALGDGETLEDSVCTALGTDQRLACPSCGGMVWVSEDSLGQFAQELLARW